MSKFRFLRKSIIEGYICSAHDVSDGGIAIALAESSIGSDLGAHWQISSNQARLDRILFAEGGSRIIVSVPSQKGIEWQLRLNQMKDKCQESLFINKIGTVLAEKELLITHMEETIACLSLSQLSESFENSIPRRIKY